MGSMKITRHLHACVEIHHNDRCLLIDPGNFGVPQSLDTADAVLLTHSHPDHADADALARVRKNRPDLPIYGPQHLAMTLPFEVRIVRHGDTFNVAGFHVEVVGSDHAMITRAQEVPENIGFLINRRVLHPGDAFQPIRNVDLALVPVNGPWVKMLDVEQWLKKFPPHRFMGIHDGMVIDAGRALNNKILGILGDTYGSKHLPLEPGESYELPT